MVEGGVYKPFASTVPWSANQTSAAFVIPVTVAVNCWEWPKKTVALVGLIARVKMFNGALPDFVGSWTLVAVTITGFVGGSVAGALYVPLDETVPLIASPPAIPFTDQVTDALKIPVPWTTTVK